MQIINGTYCYLVCILFNWQLYIKFWRFVTRDLDTFIFYIFPKRLYNTCTTETYLKTEQCQRVTRKQWYVFDKMFIYFLNVCTNTSETNLFSSAKESQGSNGLFLTNWILTQQQLGIFIIITNNKAPNMIPFLMMDGTLTFSHNLKLFSEILVH